MPIIMTLLNSFTQLKTVPGLLFQELVDGARNKTRVIDSGEAVVSVFCAIFMAHQLQLPHVGWAAFSGYMVMRSHVWISLERGVLRIMGTLSGALLAQFLAVGSHGTLYSSLAFGLVATVGLYLALTTRHGYAWLFMGITFTMVSMDGIEHGMHTVQYFAQARIVEVSIGTACSIVVSALSTALIRQRLFSVADAGRVQASSAPYFCWHTKAGFHALQGGIALALVPLAWRELNIASLSQTVITIMAVMTIPLNAVDRSCHPSRIKITHRFLGCLLGASLAFIAITLGQINPGLIYAVLVLGMFIGRTIENSGTLSFKYVGTQLTLALLVSLTPDHSHVINVDPGFSRLSGIVMGIVLLEPTRLMTRKVRVLCRKSGSGASAE